MEYDHAHPDAELFKEGSEWRPKIQTLGDYVRQKTDCPCVVVGGEYGLDKNNSDGVSGDCCVNHVDDKLSNNHTA